MTKEEIIVGRYAKGGQSGRIVKILGRGEYSYSFTAEVTATGASGDSYKVGDVSAVWDLNSFTLLPEGYTPPIAPSEPPTAPSPDPFIDAAIIACMGLDTNLDTNYIVNRVNSAIEARNILNQKK